MRDRLWRDRRFVGILFVHTLCYMLFSYATYGIPIADGSFRPAVAWLSLFSALYGPVFGFIVGFAGNMFLDIWNGEIWWNWSLGNGIIGLICGLMVMVPGKSLKQGTWSRLQISMFLMLAAAGNYIGLTLAAIIDVSLNQIPFPQAVFEWAITPATVNVLSVLILSPVLLWLYRRICFKQ